MRVKATISYDGSKFLGFQRQKSSTNTVTQTIESALESIGIESKIRGSGRTDRGVHATGQVIDFLLPPFWQKKSLIELKSRLNSKLRYIKFLHIKEVDTLFHSQYGAKKRIYRYIIKLTPNTPFDIDYTSYYKIKDKNLLIKALNLFKGEHNFKFFKKEGSFTSSDTRVIYNVKVVFIKDYIVVYFIANGYLRSQVRMMVESAILVSNNKLTLKELKEQIDTIKRHTTSLAKPEGLYLAKVIYSP